MAQCSIEVNAGIIFDSNPQNIELKGKDPKKYKIEREEFIESFTSRFEKRNGIMQRKFSGPLGADTDINGDPISDLTNAVNDHIAEFIALRVLPDKINFKEGIPNQIHLWASDTIPFYEDTTNLIADNWEGNKLILQMRRWINPMGNILYEQINKLASLYKASKEDLLKRTEVMVTELLTDLEKTFNKEELVKLDDILAHSGFFALAYKDLGGKLANNEISLEKAIELVEKDLNNSQNYKDQARSVANVYLGLDQENPGLGKMNHSNISLFSNTITEKLDALTALYALQSIEGSIPLLQKMFTNNATSYKKLIGMMVESKKMLDKLMMYNKETTFKSTGNLVSHVTDIPYEIVAVTPDMLSSNAYSGKYSGWKELRPASKTQVGLLYRESTDRLQEGIGTSVSYIKNGISLYNVKNVEKLSETDKKLVKNGSAFSTYLSEKEKKVLGYKRNPVQTITHSWSHKYLMLESQAIRDEMLENMTLSFKETDDITKVNSTLEKAIEDDDYPLFIDVKKLEETGARLSEKVLQKYEKVDKNLLTDIGNFKNKVTYIRKDWAFNVEGYNEGNMFKNSYEANKRLNQIRDIFAWIKTNMIIVNPVKITFDFIAGMTLALSRGASINEIKKYSEEAIKYSNEMSVLRNKRILKHSDYVLETDPTKKTKLKKELDEVEKQIEEHPFAGALVNGFINSLSTEMLSKERDSLTGLNARINKLLEKVLKDKNTGEYTAFNNAIKRFARKGVNIEVIYQFLADKMEGTSADGASKLLKSLAADMDRVKSKEDMTDYIGQFLLTPNSQFVRLGSAATLYADLIPRWTLYRHYINDLSKKSNEFLTKKFDLKEKDIARLKNNRAGFIEAKAALMALNDTLDYKMNMPPALKFLSDLYILPFPSFFVRIQRVLANMATQNSASFGATLLFNELSGTQSFNILGSNIFRKFEQDTIFMGPFDLLDGGKNMVPFINAFFYY